MYEIQKKLARNNKEAIKLNAERFCLDSVLVYSEVGKDYLLTKSY